MTADSTRKQTLHMPTDAPASMRWPGISAKLAPVTVLRVPFCWRPHLAFRNCHHGCWWQAAWGPWVILGGRGTYDAR